MICAIFVMENFVYLPAEGKLKRNGGCFVFKFPENIQEFNKRFHFSLVLKMNI